MSRYIDADKLHEKIIDKQVLAIYEDWDFNTVRDIRKTINEIPTADVKPLRHGHWILEVNHRFSDWGYCDVYVDMKCSRCGKPWHDGNSVWFTTLPNYDENEMPYPITEQRIKDADQRCFQEAKEIAKKYMSCELCGAKMDGKDRRNNQYDL